MPWEILKQITALAICITLIDLVTPDGSMKKYAKLVTGLIMMYTLLRPISTLIRGGIQTDEIMLFLKGMG